MFTTLSTMTIGLNFGAPAGEELKGKAIPLSVAQRVIASAMKQCGIDCYTSIHCTVYWMGDPEESVRIEVMHNEGHKDVVKAARIIKQILLQESVLVTKQEIQGDLA